MCSLFDDAALIEDDNAIHFAQGRESVRDRDDGFSLHEFVECPLDLHFAFAVER